jgi:DNA ligase-1
MSTDNKVFKALQDKVTRYINRDLRYGLDADEIRSIFNDVLLEKVPAADDLSRRTLIFRYVSKFVDMQVPHEQRKALSSSLKETSSYEEWALDKLLDEALTSLEAVEKIGTKINPKLELLKAKSSNPVLRDCFRYAYNWKMAYGIGTAFKVDEKVKGKGKLGVKPWKLFIDLLQKLSSLPAANSAHKEKLKKTLEKMPRRTRKWALRILKRDLKIGVKDGGIRKVWPSLLPSFAVTLCSTITSTDEKDLSALPERLWVEPKLDGLRLELVVYDAREQRGKVFTREGLEQVHLQYLIPEASQMVKSCGFTSGVFDCEGISTSSTRYSDAVSAVTTSKGKSEHKLVLMCFDFVPLESFELGEDKTTQRKRRLRLQELFDTGGHFAPSMKIVPGVRVGQKRGKHILDLYSQWRKQGYEGVVIKDADATYAAGEKNRKRSGYFRIKPFETVDVTIVGFEPGTPGTKNEGVLGAFHCKTAEGVDIWVGGGFKDEERKKFWSMRSKLKGRIAEIKRQKDTPGIKTRHASFVRLREHFDKKTA